MNWTPKPPTEPGYYWLHRNPYSTTIELVKVVSLGPQHGDTLVLAGDVVLHVAGYSWSDCPVEVPALPARPAIKVIKP